MNHYGRKGGTSATKGKKKSIYEAIAPDGKLLRCASFLTDAQTAYMAVSSRQGRWYANCVRNTPEFDGTWIKCRKMFGATNAVS